MNFTYPQGAELDYEPLHVVGGSKSNSYQYAINEPVVINYDAWNSQFATKTFDVTFEVKNLTGQNIFNDTKQVVLKPCIGHQMVNSTFIPKISGTYEVDVTFDNSLTGTTIEIPSQNYLQNESMYDTSKIPEFPTGLIALAAGFTSIVVIHRIRK